MSAIKKSNRCSQVQKEHLINFMSKHRSIGLNSFNCSMGQQRHAELWAKLTHELSELGPYKSVDQWKTTWRDMKSRAKASNAAVYRAQRQTGNSVSVPSLSFADDAILSVIGRTSSEGLPNVPETGLGAVSMEPATATSSTTTLAFTVVTEIVTTTSSMKPSSYTGGFHQPNYMETAATATSSMKPSSYTGGFHQPNYMETAATATSAMTPSLVRDKNPMPEPQRHISQAQSSHQLSGNDLPLPGTSPLRRGGSTIKKDLGQIYESCTNAHLAVLTDISNHLANLQANQHANQVERNRIESERNILLQNKIKVQSERNTLLRIKNQLLERLLAQGASSVVLQSAFDEEH